MFRRVWLTFFVVVVSFFFSRVPQTRTATPSPLVLATNTALRHPQSLGPRSMPQVVPLLPTFPSKTMFGSLSSDTIKLRQEKLDLYLSKLIKIPEVWRSPEMANFLDDSAKVLANLTVDLRVERVVHLHRLVANAKDAKDQEKEPSQKASRTKRRSFHTVSPLEATGINYFGNNLLPAVKPRRGLG